MSLEISKIRVRKIKEMSSLIRIELVKQALLIVALSLLATTSQAQNWEVGGWFGTAHYFGDLNPNFAFDQPELAGGLIARFNLNDRLAIKFGGNLGHISGNDALSDDVFQRNRNLSFRSEIKEGNLNFEFNFLKYIHGSKYHKFTPYVFVGTSLYNFNPQAQLNGEWHDLQPLGTEGQFRGSEYYLTQVAFNYGGGFKFDISYDWSVNLFISSRRLFTDYLDDVSKVYADPNDLEEIRNDLAVLLADRSLNNSGIAGNQRGNSKNNDAYAFIGIGLIYNFARLDCPWF